jgi:hypothetical protein
MRQNRKREGTHPLAAKSAQPNSARPVTRASAGLDFLPPTYTRLDPAPTCFRRARSRPAAFGLRGFLNIRLGKILLVNVRLGRVRLARLPPPYALVQRPSARHRPAWI